MKKTQNRILSAAVPLALALLSVSSNAAVDAAVSGYARSGAFIAPIAVPAKNAVKISTAQQLHDIRNNLSGSYVLTADIYLSDFNGGEWAPIGDGEKPFLGNFDGRGHVIRNLRITGG